MRHIVFLAVALSWPATVSAQYFNWGSAEFLNCRLHGQVVDYTHTVCKDNRICSSILGRPRDLFVYLPPGYNANHSYSLVIYLHPGAMDERALVASKWLVEMDRMIACGEMPPVVLACPDGLYGGDNLCRDPHSLFVNGCGGRFEDYLLSELVPFMITTYAVRPERDAHGIVGVSAGGYGGMGLALKHREMFGAVATLSAPVEPSVHHGERQLLRGLRSVHVPLERVLRPEPRDRALLLGPRKGAGEEVHGPGLRLHLRRLDPYQDGQPG